MSAISNIAFALKSLLSKNIQNYIKSTSLWHYKRQVSTLLIYQINFHSNLSRAWP